MKKSRIILIAIMMVALAAATAFAWDHGRGRYGSNKDCPGYGYRGAAADLTQEQKDQLSDLRQKFVDETYEIRSAKIQKHNELRMLMETSTPAITELNALSAEIGDLTDQLREQRIKFALEAKKIAPELGSMGFGQGRGGKWGKRGGGRGGCGGPGYGWQGQGQNQ